MTKYQKDNAVEKIDGYFMPRANEGGVEGAFERAKAECILQLNIQLRNIQLITLTQFKEGTLRGVGDDS